MDEYQVLGSQNCSIKVPGDADPGATGTLALLPCVFQGLDDLLLTNRSFAFIAPIAHTASYTPGTDPWYLTESLGRSGPLGLEVSYRIKAGRPALSCWEESLFCLNGVCSGSVLEGLDLPKGLKINLSQRLMTPMTVELGLLAGASALKSYVGSSAGGFVDAASSTVEADLSRLVLTAFLATRDVFRDSTMFGSGSGIQNSLLDSKGDPAQGAADFVIKAHPSQQYPSLLLSLSRVSV